MRTLCLLLPALGAASLDAFAQETPDTAGKAWSFTASAYYYIVPVSRDFVQPTVTADHDWLHLEGRYNYEALDAASLWVGYNFSAGHKLTLDITPMVGGVIGSTTGVAAGYELSLGYWKLDLSSDTEYVIDTGDSANGFLYTWSQLSILPVPWLQAGLAVQRTRVYETERDLQRGFLVGFTWKQVGFTTYLFDPDTSQPTVVLALELSF